MNGMTLANARGLLKRNYGHPKTEAQRRATHKALFGNTKLPKRGTGLGRKLAMRRLLARRRRNV